VSERVIVVNADSTIFQLFQRQTSVEYRHDVQLPSRGIVTDMPVSQSSSQQPKVYKKIIHFVISYKTYMVGDLHEKKQEAKY
jgi:hypothetical protein